MPCQGHEFARRSSVTQQRRLSQQFGRNAWLAPLSDVRIHSRKKIKSKPELVQSWQAQKEHLCRRFRDLLSWPDGRHRDCNPRPYLPPRFHSDNSRPKQRSWSSNRLHHLRIKEIRRNPHGEDHGASNAPTYCSHLQVALLSTVVGDRYHSSRFARIQTDRSFKSTSISCFSRMGCQNAWWTSRVNGAKIC